jgi:hypothetical protein
LSGLLGNGLVHVGGHGAGQRSGSGSRGQASPGPVSLRCSG